MVNYCTVCKKYGDSNIARSFHRFPIDPKKRRAWFRILELPEDKVLSKSAVICSDHFSSKYFIPKPSGVKYLAANALPLGPSSSQFESSSFSHHSTLPSDPKSEDKENETPVTPEVQITFEDRFQLLKCASSVENFGDNIGIINANSSHKNRPELVPNISSSTTLTASPLTFGSTSTVETENESEKDADFEPPPKKRKLGRPRYFGDCHSSDMCSPTRAKRNWKIAKQTVVQQRRKICSLQQRNRRLQARVFCLKSLLKYLKDNYYISESAEAVIEATVPGDAAEILKKILKGPSHQKYRPILRSFALTLHFYSPKAYDFVREKFNNTFPYPKTISKWYQSVSGKPGFTEEAHHAIEVKVTAAKEEKLLVNLVLDEMYIMKKIEWTGEKFTGYVDIGTNLDSDCVPQATEALVFMVVALNSNWKIPVGYFLVHGLSGMEKANLVTKCLEFLNDTGIKITSMAFDGAVANISMAKYLSANFENTLALKTFFNNLFNNEKIYIFLDPSHMIKLIRNFLGSLKDIKNGNKENIDWAYLEKLVRLQDDEGLHAGTKLKKRHMQWTQEKMRVKIAAQTLSKSVADALLFLEKDLKFEEFKGAEPTANFILVFNNLFDIFNSRNVFAKYLFKKAISPENKDNIFNYLEYCKAYISTLTVNNESVLKSNRKTGFLGFLVCIESLKGLYDDLVKNEIPLLKYTLTYKLSQDHIEVFFSAMRSKCGSNNNPTARLFEANYKKLLVHCEVRGSDAANAVALDSTSILYCNSNKLTKTEYGEDMRESQEYMRLAEELHDHDYLSSSAWHLTDYVEDVIIYIAGFVVRSLEKCINCVKCKQIIDLQNPAKVSNLQKRKTYGSLKYASSFVIEICKTAEKCVRLLLTQSGTFGTGYRHFKNYIVMSSLRNLRTEIFDSFGDHRFECDPLNDHALLVAKLILEKYISIRIHRETVRMHEISINKRVRSLLTKTVLFKSQLFADIN